MPTYNFLNEDTGEQTEVYMKISELDEYKQNNPHLKQQIIKAPVLGDSMRLGVRKTDSNFNDLLKHIKKGNSKGITKSTINTR